MVFDIQSYKQIQIMPYPKCLEVFHILDFRISAYTKWDIIGTWPKSKHKIHLYFTYTAYTWTDGNFIEYF